MYYYIHDCPIPRTFDEWIEFRAATAAYERRRLQRKLENKPLESRAKQTIKETAGTSTKAFMKADETQGIPRGNLSAVLGLETMWVRDWKNGRFAGTQWPSQEEYNWEGDCRRFGGKHNDEDFGRCLPLVRQWDPTIAWSYRARLPESELDAVARVPTEEDLWYKHEEITSETALHLLGKDILEALDNGGDPPEETVAPLPASPTASSQLQT